MTTDGKLYLIKHLRKTKNTARFKYARYLIHCLCSGLKAFRLKPIVFGSRLHLVVTVLRRGF